MGNRLQTLSTWLTFPVSSPSVKQMTQAANNTHATDLRASHSNEPGEVPVK